MPKVRINNNEHEVDPKFLETITSRLSTRLASTRSQRISVDTLTIKSELDRLYGQGLAQKPWYRDFVVQFCRDRKIHCNVAIL